MQAASPGLGWCQQAPGCPVTPPRPQGPPSPQALGVFGSSAHPAPARAPADEDDPVVEDGQHHDADPPVVPVSGGIQGPAPGSGGAAGGGRGTSGLPHPGQLQPLPGCAGPRPPPALHRAPAASGSSAQPAPCRGTGCSVPMAPMGLMGVPATRSHPGPHGGEPCHAHPQACPVPAPGLAMAMSPVVPRGWGRTQRRDSRELRLCILHRECGCW